MYNYRSLMWEHRVVLKELPTKGGDLEDTCVGRCSLLELFKMGDRDCGWLKI